MDQKEWKRLRDSNRSLLDFTYYNNAREIQKSLKYNQDPNAIVIHHLRDTEEQRLYNDTYYERWGFEIDENGNTNFEYGKYVLFVTEEWHHNYHSHSEETRKKISDASKERWQNISYREKMIQVLNLPCNRERNSECVKQLWQTDAYRDKIMRSHTDEYRELKSLVSANNWKDSQYRDNVTSASKERWNDTSFREKMLKIYSTKEYRQKLSDASKKMWENDDYRAKIVESSKRSWLNEEYRNKVIQALKASWTDEKRAAHSEKHKGKNNPMYGLKGKDHPAFGNVLSEETRKKMSDSWTDERKRLQSERMSGENNHNYGKSLSDNTKEHISSTLKEYFKTHDNPMCGKHHSSSTRERMRAAWTDERKRKHKELIDSRKLMYNKYKDLGGNLCWREFVSLLCKFKEDLSSLNEDDVLTLLISHNK